MTPNTPAEIARYAFDATRGEAFQIAHGAYVLYTDHLAAVQAAERRAVERCTQIAATTGRIVTDGIARQGRYEQGYARARHDIEETIRALDLGASKEEIEDYGPGRCRICGWPLAADRANGCVDGNCAYRPTQGGEVWHKIVRRREHFERLDRAAKGANRG